MAAGSTNVQIVHEVSALFYSGYSLAFQAVRYVYPGGKIELGFRFIWRDREGRLLPQRGQARIPSYDVQRRLLEAAESAGWLPLWQSTANDDVVVSVEARR